MFVVSWTVAGFMSCQDGKRERWREEENLDLLWLHLIWGLVVRLCADLLEAVVLRSSKSADFWLWKLAKSAFALFSKNSFKIFNSEYFAKPQRYVTSLPQLPRTDKSKYIVVTTILSHTFIYSRRVFNKLLTSIWLATGLPQPCLPHVSSSRSPFLARRRRSSSSSSSRSKKSRSDLWHFWK